MGLRGDGAWDWDGLGSWASQFQEAKSVFIGRGGVVGTHVRVVEEGGREGDGRVSKGGRQRCLAETDGQRRWARQKGILVEMGKIHR